MRENCKEKGADEQIDGDLDYWILKISDFFDNIFFSTLSRHLTT